MATTVSSTEYLKQVDDLLAKGNQSWLFGAGISRNACVPLMYPLTDRVSALADDANDSGAAKKLLGELKGCLPGSCHIEHMLSHLADHVAIADRTTEKKVTIGSDEYSVADLQDIHKQILVWIGETIRWGYVPKDDEGGTPERIGTPTEPIVTIAEHKAFVEALFNRSQAGIAERRTAVKLFTTNYDTLMEDALALQCCPYWDGFTGGALAYRSFHYRDDDPTHGYRAHLVKLHGSIDWHLGEDDRVWRVRDGDNYPTRTSRVLIYPQATKYLATQRDPFAAQFDLFRRSLHAATENVLAICGYAFGDEHINDEIELAMQRPDNKTTLLAFSMDQLPILKKWQEAPWGQRVYVLAKDGLYVGQEGPLHPPAEDSTHNWWTFTGVTHLLSSGAEASIK